MGKYRVETEDGKVYEINRVETEDGKVYEIETDDEVRVPSAKAVTAGAGQTPQSSDTGVGRFREEAWKRIDPIAQYQSMVMATTQPLDTLKGIGQAQGTLLQQAIDAFNQGKYARALRKGIHGMIPLFGLDLDAAADMAEKGDIGGALGATVGTAAGIAGPEIVRNIQSAPVVPRIQNYNPLEQQAINAAVAEGVPLSAGTATGNKWIRGFESAASNTPLGSLVAYGRNRQVEPAFQQWGQRLAERALPGQPMVPELAGRQVRNNLQTMVDAYTTRADAQYGPVWQLEANPSSRRSVQQGWEEVPDPSGALDPATGQPAMIRQPVMEDVAMPVDVRGIKTLVAPLEARLSRVWEPAQQYSSRGLHAMRSILNGPDYIPARDAELSLGGLKRLSREDPQGVAGGDVARQIIPELQQRVDAGVSAIDPRATQQLRQGREWTRISHEIRDVLDELRQEPVQAYGQMTERRDTSIDRMRNIEREAPGSGRIIGRAWLEEELNSAMATGGFTKTQTLLNHLNALGRAQLEIMFPNPVLRRNIREFALAAQKYGTNPNPSGTAGMLTATGSVSGMGGFVSPLAVIASNLGAAGVAALLYSPRTAQTLLRGMRIPLGNRAANAMWVTNLIREAGRNQERLQVSAEDEMPAPSGVSDEEKNRRLMRGRPTLPVGR